MIEDDTNPKDHVGATKPPLHLVPPALLLYLSRVMGLGAAKYGPYNWRTKKVKYSIYLDAAMRHLLAALDGESDDPESGMPHLAHVAACCGIILDAQVTGNLIDDRPAKGKAAELTRWLTRTPSAPTKLGFVCKGCHNTFPEDLFVQGVPQSHFCDHQAL